MNRFTLLLFFCLNSLPAIAFTNRPPSRPLYSNRYAPLAVSSWSSESTVQGQQDANTPLQAFETAVVEEVIQTNRNDGLYLVAVAAGVGYMALSHFDSSVAQHAALSIQHMAKQAPMQAWNSYQHVLAENPISTKAATSATVYSIGDVLSQKSQGTSLNELDKGRVLRSLIAGGVAHGPLSHVWYNLSEGFFTNIAHMTAWWSFIPKIVVDQTVWGPIWNSMYILLIGSMKFESPEKILGDVKQSTFPLFLDGLKLWPLAHCVTYGLIPVENRLLWVDLIEILWVMILASKAASLSSDTKEVEPQ